MKKFFLLFLLTISTNCFANYTTPGTGVIWNLDSLVTYSGGNVTFSGGNYLVNDTIVIAASDTIKVTSNATMKFGTLVFIDIFGVLIINPTDSAKITAQDSTLKFLGLKFEDQSDGSVLKNLIFEYGNSIRMLDCDILIDSCIIRFNNLNSTFASGAISFFRSNSIVRNSKIYRNRRAAIVSGANIASSPIIENNLIYENDTDNANVPQINFGATSSSPMIIRGNTITGMFIMSGGISFLPVGSAPNVIIENNIIKKNRYGIAVAGGNGNYYINNNIIDSNNIQGNPVLGGSGINFNGTATQVSIVTRNIIRGNLWGITIQGTAKPNMGNLSNSDTTDVGLNQMYNNGNSNKIFDLFNNTLDSIKAENNYWGSGNIDTVESHIFHKNDSAVLGYVDFIPLRSINLNLTVLNEAMYNPGNNTLTRKDTFTVYLHDAVSPFTLRDSAKATIDTLSFTGNFSFTNSPTGQYYFSVKHFNSIETWSKSGGESLTSNSAVSSVYNMTTSTSQAYGSNQQLKGSKYCIYSGDVDQNGIVDASDLSSVENTVGTEGYRLVNDLNADEIVDVYEIALVENNAGATVMTIAP